MFVQYFVTIFHKNFYYNISSLNVSKQYFSIFGLFTFFIFPQVFLLFYYIMFTLHAIKYIPIHTAMNLLFTSGICEHNLLILRHVLQSQTCVGGLRNFALWQPHRLQYWQILEKNLQGSSFCRPPQE